MQRYKTIFDSSHTVYRLITTSADLQIFAAGICRLYRNVFDANKVVLIYKSVAPLNFLKVRLEGKRQYIKKGGLSILTRIEKEILKREKEMIFNNRLIYPFIFTDILGGIYVKRDSKKKGFEETERRWFLSLCEEVSIGLRVFNLYQDQQKIMLSYIKSLSELMTRHVPTSYLHTKTMSRLTKSIGKALRLSEMEIKALEQASILHDAGKIQLPSKLLKKQKPLTEEEFKLITMHPKKGAELFKNLETLKPAIPIILHHHERYDGKGYPSRLKKEKIPLGSRILAILDSFDAMYFGRPYKKRRPLTEIIEEFKKQKGKQFDPKIIDIFLKILKRKSIRKKLEPSSKK